MYICLTQRCLALNNFNTLMAIQSAFNSSTITRLKKTWEVMVTNRQLLSNKTRATFEGLKKATDHSRNYADYRQQLRKVALPCLPFLGLFLTDLTFTDDGNPDTRNAGKLINFDKYAKTARIIRDLIRYQAPYALAEVLEIQALLFQSIDERSGMDVQELYEHSLKLEPRDNQGPPSATTPGMPEDMHRELEAKIEMLERAGML
jgi:RasGEF domain